MDTERGSATDRRSRRTRRLVTAAMTELLVETPYDRITVQAILDRADIGRATFYHHFRDKLDVVDAVAADMFEGIPASRSGAGDLPLVELFRHAAERHTSLRAMLDAPGAEVFWRESHEALSGVIERLRGGSSGEQRPAASPAVAAQFVAGGLISVLRWWLRAGMPYPPEQMAALIEALTPELVHPTARRQAR